MKLNKERIELLRQRKVIIYNDKSDESVKLLKEIVDFISNRFVMGSDTFYYINTNGSWESYHQLSNDHKYIKQHFPAWFFEEELNNKTLLLL
jgi:hypothetical protein